jgi:hypothetical protein
MRWARRWELEIRAIETRVSLICCTEEFIVEMVLVTGVGM